MQTTGQVTIIKDNSKSYDNLLATLSFLYETELRKSIKIKECTYEVCKIEEDVIVAGDPFDSIVRVIYVL